VIAVEEFASPWSQKGEDVFEVRCRARSGAESRWIERAAPRREQDKASETAADLVAARSNVLVRDAVAYQMEEWSHKQCRKP